MLPKQVNKFAVEAGFSDKERWELQQKLANFAALLQMHFQNQFVDDWADMEARRKKGEAK